MASLLRSGRPPHLFLRQESVLCRGFLTCLWHQEWVLACGGSLGTSLPLPSTASVLGRARQKFPLLLHFAQVSSVLCWVFPRGRHLPKMLS